MRLLIVLLSGLLLLLQVQLWSQDGGLPQVWQLRGALAEQEARNERLRQRNAALEAEVRDLKDGLEALEERARSELGMIREGEVFYQVAEP
ncbi:MAG: cell division protein FtsB [Ectothiorhodospiraceae bacterium]|nr:cell division protein FtsB [Ectothiorhodospiraceae bacterium]